MLEELKQSVDQDGLKSSYTQAIMAHICSNLRTPHDVKMIAKFILNPAQHIQFLQRWQELCDQAAAVTPQQGDPLYGVQAQMLLGNGPYIRADWQA